VRYADISRSVSAITRYAKDIPPVDEDNFKAMINAMLEDDKFDDMPSYISSISRNNLTAQEAYKL